MEFKDKLKNLRKERGISQQALADAIFVSRSAVAKWENGLGYPNESSYTALMEYFGVDKTAFETERAEEVLVEKNKSIHRLKTILGSVALLFFVVVAFALPFLLLSGDYAFSSEMVAGTFADDECIHLSDYDIYWYTIMAEEEYACIDGFRPVKKNFYGYTFHEEDYNYREVFWNGKKIGILYSIEGEDGYYNILKKQWGTYIEPSDILVFEKVEVSGKEYEVSVNSFFITEELVKEFKIGEEIFVVDDVVQK